MPNKRKSNKSSKSNRTSNTPPTPAQIDAYCSRCGADVGVDASAADASTTAAATCPTCPTCQVITYCSPTCQASDAPVHALVCREYARFLRARARPKRRGAHILALVLPVGNAAATAAAASTAAAAVQPRFAWIDAGTLPPSTALLDGVQIYDVETILGRPTVVQTVRVVEELRAHFPDSVLYARSGGGAAGEGGGSVRMYVRQAFAHDGSVANECIRAITAGTQSNFEWCGPVVIVGMVDVKNTKDGQDEVQHGHGAQVVVDFRPAHFRLVVDFLRGFPFGGGAEGGARGGDAAMTTMSLVANRRVEINQIHDRVKLVLGAFFTIKEDEEEGDLDDQQVANRDVFGGASDIKDNNLSAVEQMGIIEEDVAGEEAIPSNEDGGEQRRVNSYDSAQHEQGVSEQQTIFDQPSMTAESVSNKALSTTTSSDADSLISQATLGITATIQGVVISCLGDQHFLGRAKYFPLEFQFGDSLFHDEEPTPLSIDIGLPLLVRRYRRAHPEWRDRAPNPSPPSDCDEGPWDPFRNRTAAAMNVATAIEHPYWAEADQLKWSLQSSTVRVARADGLPISPLQVRALATFWRRVAVPRMRRFGDMVDAVCVAKQWDQARRRAERAAVRAMCLRRYNTRAAFEKWFVAFRAERVRSGHHAWAHVNSPFEDQACQSFILEPYGRWVERGG